MTEYTEPELVGTALSFQMASGYLVTVVGIIALPEIESALGWRYAFATLAPGAAIAFAAMFWLDHERRKDNEKASLNDNNEAGAADHQPPDRSINKV